MDVMMTKAHNLYRYLFNICRDNNEFVSRFYNLSDEEFDRAIEDIVSEHEGLLPEWD